MSTAAREAREEMSSAVAGSSAAISSSKPTLIAINSVCFLALFGGSIFISRNVVRRLHRLNGAIVGLAGGDLERRCAEGRPRRATDMAGAVSRPSRPTPSPRRSSRWRPGRRGSALMPSGHGREAEKAEEARQAQATIAALADGLDRLAHGDLLCQIDTPFAPDAEKLRTDFNAAVGKLKEIMLAIVTSTQAIGSGTEELSSAADDLSRRTEQQAASLEETAAALDEITATVKKAVLGSPRPALKVTGAFAGTPCFGSRTSTKPCGSCVASTTSARPRRRFTGWPAISFSIAGSSIRFGRKRKN